MNNNITINSLPFLTEKEAVHRLKTEGHNELPTSKRRDIFTIAFGIISDPMFLLLAAGGTLYLFLGSVYEAIMLFGFVIFVMGITLYQEHKTERALESLHRLASPRALVIRDGKERRIAGVNVVRDDIVIVHEGDSIPADALVLISNNLTIDESILTGESVPVQKLSSSNAKVYSGTQVVQGDGIIQVYAIGLATEIGKIGTSLQKLKPEKTPLQKETGRLVKKIATIGLILSLILVIIFGFTRHNWLSGILVGITLAMSILPEEMPVILTVFLSIGAWRIAKKRVLTRHIPAIETLGAATVLCVDKTGTLTQNQMTLAEIYTKNECCDLRKQGLPDKFHELIEYSVLASRLESFDPMEKAINKVANKYLAKTDHVHSDWKLIREYPLSKELLAISNVWESEDSKNYIIAAKGSPEAIFDLCHLDKKQFDFYETEVEKLASDGLRVLGVAKASFKDTNLPKNQHKFEFKFVGLLGLYDPIRLKVPEAIAECHNAGIRVIMLTGDYPVTAENIAKEIGLDTRHSVLTGSELLELTEKELQKRLKTTHVCARIMPEQKLRLVNALKANGEIVAMTGDGVNDAPALKAAHIGIAMGKRGADVAREAASLVLLDDDFSSIVKAIRLGRRIFDNIKKAFSYTLAVHIPIAGLAFIPILFHYPLVLFPVHVVFLELIIDPACSIIFEAEKDERNIMRRPPRDSREKIFQKKTLHISLLQGFSVFGIILAVFGIAKHLGFDELSVRTIVFIVLVLTNIAMILTNRSFTESAFKRLKTKNKALWWVIGSALALLVAVLYIPFLQHLFHFAKPSVIELFVSLAIALGGFGILEVIKKQF